MYRSLKTSPALLPSPLAGEGPREGLEERGMPAGQGMVKPCSTPPASKAQGFTLVEIIIALALTALILASLSAALYGLSQGFARASLAGERSDTLNRVSLALRLAIEQARFIEAAQNGKLIPSLVGTADSIDFLAMLPESSPQAGLHHWNLHVENGELLLTLTPWIDPKDAAKQDFASEAPASLPPHQVLQNVTQFNLAYQNAKTGEWQDQWDDPFLPARVRLDISSEALDAWPPIIVRLEP